MLSQVDRALGQIATLPASPALRREQINLQVAVANALIHTEGYAAADTKVALAHGTAITALGFGRDAMNRIQNHKEGGIASVYDRHQYADENKRVMEAVATKIISTEKNFALSNVFKLH